MLLTLFLTPCFMALAFVVHNDIGTRSRSMAFVVFVYLALLTGLGISEVFAAHSDGFPPLGIKLMNGFLGLLIISLLVKRTRQIWLSIPTKRLAMWHWVRIPVGIAFLALAYSGELAPEFGFCAGAGDVVIGLWAISYVLSPLLGQPLGTSMWNAAAFGDTLASLALATLTLASPFQVFPEAERMGVMNSFPLVVVTGFGIPMLILSNFIVFRQVRMACCSEVRRKESAAQSWADVPAFNL